MTASILHGASSITVLTGAGISTASGIPDFRGPQGIWTLNPAAARMFDIDAYMNDPEVRVAAWRARRDHPVWQARPNAAHVALTGLQAQGRLRALATQNIDGLHQAAGSEGVLEVHGTIHVVVCMECDQRLPTPEVLERVQRGEEDPPCLACGGILKVDTVSFGQALDATVLSAAWAAAEQSEVLLTAGTSLQVQPIAGMVDRALAAGVPVVIANASPTPYDAYAAELLRLPLEQCLPELCSLP